MSYNSKKSITSMVVGILLVTAYIIYALGSHSPEDDNVKGWAILMLVFIGIGIGAMIVIMILFHIVYAVGIAVKEKKQGNEPDESVERIMKSSMVEDERDKLIERKSNSIEHTFSGLGLVGMLFTLALGAPMVAALHIMLGATCAGMLIGGCVNIYYHERGL